MATMTYGRALLSEWTIEPGVRFLNHGSYGAVPRVVQAAQAQWRERMEAQSAAFFFDILPVAVREAAAHVAPYFGATPERFVFVENASTGTNAVLGSLTFAASDEIVVADHTYNAVRMNLVHLTARTGVRIVVADIGLPVADDAQIMTAFERALSPKTKLIITDHIASASAVVFPIEAIVALGRAAGVPVLIDGAHGPGMFDLDLGALGATWYVGNLHKWLCAPHGAAFIVAHTNAPAIHPPVISHGYGKGFTAEFDYPGTRDSTAWLATAAAIAFHEKLGGTELRRRNRNLAAAAGQTLAAALGTEMGAPPSHYGSIVTARLPVDLPATREIARAVRAATSRRHRMEVAVTPMSGHLWLRVSAAPYNEAADYDGVAELVLDAARSVQAA